MAILLRVVAACATIVLSACVTPASEIKVPTASMEEAWRGSSGASIPPSTGNVVPAVLKQDQPLPVVSAPDIRMAYIFAKPDSEGNMHYGSWVAIPVAIFKWLMPEGAALPIGQTAVAGPTPQVAK